MTNYYDPDIRAQQDYEAMNADVRKQLSAALKRIEELKVENEKLRDAISSGIPSEMIKALQEADDD